MSTCWRSVQSLGGIAVGDPGHAAELTSIERPPNSAEEVPVMIGRLLDAHETIIGAVRDGIDKTGKSGDWGSNDILMSDVLRRHELQVWFLRNTSSTCHSSRPEGMDRSFTVLHGAERASAAAHARDRRPYLGFRTG